MNTTVDATHPVAPLTIVFATDASSVTGTVRDARGPVSRAQVVVVPEGPFGEDASRARNAFTDDKGSFTLYAVRPGGYRVFAFPYNAQNSPMDPGFRAAYLGQSLRITVKPSSQQTLPLRAISVK